MREIERKYDVPAGTGLFDPGELLGDGLWVRREEKALDAVYFDTEDLRLLGAGVTLRRRVGGTDPGWHLKLPVGPDQREELQLPLGTAVRRPPAELVALVRVHSRGAKLGPVADLRTRRRTWVQTCRTGGVLAELVDDQVTARIPGSTIPSRSWREIEVELGERGTVELLEQTENQLLAAGLSRASAHSKLARALGRPSPVETVAGQLPSRITAGDVVLAYLQDHTCELRRQDPLVRRDLPDALHQMRVETRRIRSALQAYGTVIDRDRTRKLVGELGWIAGELGPARDTEVMAERFAAMLDQLPDELVLGPVRASLTRTFTRRRAEARRRALAALDTDRYLELHALLDSLFADPPLAARASRPAHRELTRDVAVAYRRVEERMKAARRAAPGSGRDVALHDVRKAAKRLRYATEVATPVLGRPARRLARKLKAVQDLLGERQDTVVARLALRGLGIAAHRDGENSFTYGLLHAVETDRAARAERDLLVTWKKLGQQEAASWLRP